MSTFLILLFPFYELSMIMNFNFFMFRNVIVSSFNMMNFYQLLTVYNKDNNLVFLVIKFYQYLGCVYEFIG